MKPKTSEWYEQFSTPLQTKLLQEIPNWVEKNTKGDLEINESKVRSFIKEFCFPIFISELLRQKQEVVKIITNCMENDWWENEGVREQDGKDFVPPAQLKRLEKIVLSHLIAELEGRDE